MRSNLFVANAIVFGAIVTSLPLLVYVGDEPLFVRLLMVLSLLIIIYQAVRFADAVAGFHP